MPCLDDATVARLLDGALDPPEAEAARSHLDTCSPCRQLVAAALPRTRSGPTLTPEAALAAPPRLTRGATVGRYLVLDPIGAGAMGVVYAAFDPELDRKIALKLIRGGGGPDSAARTLREAQAMARLSHPNVVSVYDVGTLGSQLFVAMKLVEGGSLRHWLEGAHSQDEIAQVLLQAGRGLQAAHEAGIVHRDFKPDNVLVGKGGEVQVTDFGLARREPASGSAPDLAELRALHASPPVAETLPGSMVGSPAYMAPEQLRGEPADARSDQFAFCVTAFEALFGARPFGGATVLKLNEAVLAGRIDWPVKSARAPAWLRRTLTRGLSAEASQRFASMAGLLGELERSRARRHQRWLYAASAVTVLAGVLAFRLLGRPCTGAEALLAGVWDEARAAKMQAAFAATGSELAADAFAAARRAFDSYARSWAAQRTEACLATNVRREQSPEMLDLRLSCLDQRRRELASLVEEMLAADQKLVARAAFSVQALGGLDLCASAEALRQRVLPPADPQKRTRVVELREGLARAKALLASARYQPGLEKVAPVVTASRGLYRPLEAEALLVQGRLENGAGDPKAAAVVFRAATVAAAAGRAAAVGASAWDELASTTASRLGQPAEGRKAAEQGAALIESIGGDDRLSARHERTLDLIAFAEGKLDEALAHAQRSLVLLEKLDGPGAVSLAEPHNSIGETLRVLGKPKEGMEHHRLAVQLWEKAYGPNDPRVAVGLNNLAGDQLTSGDTPGALVTWERALAVREKALGKEHPDVAVTLGNLAGAYAEVGRLDQAKAAAQRSFDIKQKTYGPDNPSLAYALIALAKIASVTGEYEQGVAWAGRAVELRMRSFGPEAALTIEALCAHGGLLETAGRQAESLAVYQRAVAAAARTLPLDHGLRMQALMGLGTVSLQLGRSQAAVLPLEQVVTAMQAQPFDPMNRAIARSSLGMSLWNLGRDRPRAVALVRKASQDAQESGPLRKQSLKYIDEWLALHDRGGAR